MTACSTTRHGFILQTCCTRRLWLRSRASVLLSECRGFDSPGLHVEVSLGKILKIMNPKLLLMCCSASCISATTISLWMYVRTTVSRFGQKLLLNDLNVKWNDPKSYLVSMAVWKGAVVPSQMFLNFLSVSKLKKKKLKMDLLKWKYCECFLKCNNSHLWL